MSLTPPPTAADPAAKLARDIQILDQLPSFELRFILGRIMSEPQHDEDEYDRQYTAAVIHRVREYLEMTPGSVHYEDTRRVARLDVVHVVQALAAAEIAGFADSGMSHKRIYLIQLRSRYHQLTADPGCACQDCQRGTSAKDG